MHNTENSTIYKYKYKATAQYRNTNTSTNTACDTSRPNEAGKPKMRQGHSPKYEKHREIPDLRNPGNQRGYAFKYNKYYII